LSLLSENPGIEDGRDFKNGPNSIANLDREMLVKRSLRACFPVVYLLLTMPGLKCCIAQQEFDHARH
jgi:hypothetical protein